MRGYFRKLMRKCIVVGYKTYQFYGVGCGLTMEKNDVDLFFVA